MARIRKPKMYPAPRRCSGKVRYPSKHEAAAVKTEQELRNPDLELSIYRCHICKDWHLTRLRH